MFDMALTIIPFIIMKMISVHLLWTSASKLRVSAKVTSKKFKFVIKHWYVINVCNQTLKKTSEDQLIRKTESKHQISTQVLKIQNGKKIERTIWKGRSCVKYLPRNTSKQDMPNDMFYLLIYWKSSDNAPLFIHSFFYDLLLRWQIDMG